MSGEILALPSERGTLTFVRADQRFATGPLNTRHAALVEVLGLKPEQIKQPDVDMGIIVRSWEMVSVAGYSYGYDWPPRDIPELRQKIRDETVAQIQALYPNLDVSGL